MYSNKIHNQPFKYKIGMYDEREASSLLLEVALTYN